MTTAHDVTLGICPSHFCGDVAVIRTDRALDNGLVDVRRAGHRGCIQLGHGRPSERFEHPRHNWVRTLVRTGRLLRILPYNPCRAVATGWMKPTATPILCVT
jgi:hypothetical protein